MTRTVDALVLSQQLALQRYLTCHRNNDMFGLLFPDVVLLLDTSQIMHFLMSVRHYWISPYNIIKEWCAPSV